MRKPAERFAAPFAEPMSRSETATRLAFGPETLMSWSLNIGTIAGTAVRVHVTFLLFLGWIFGASWIAGGPEAAWQALAFLVLLFACVVAHEFGHIFTARAFGVSTPDVTLLPIGGVARLERIPEAPYEEFLVAIAGPLVNVAITIALIARRRRAGEYRRSLRRRKPRCVDDRSARGGEFVSRCVQHDPGLSHGRRPGPARPARGAPGLRPRDQSRGLHRPGRCLRAWRHRSCFPIRC